MTDPAGPGGPMLSVRGEAGQVVVPDYVILAGAIEFSRESKAEAVRAARLRPGPPYRRPHRAGRGGA